MWKLKDIIFHIFLVHAATNLGCQSWKILSFITMSWLTWDVETEWYYISYKCDDKPEMWKRWHYLSYTWHDWPEMWKLRTPLLTFSYHVSMRCTGFSWALKQHWVYVFEILRYCIRSLLVEVLQRRNKLLSNFCNTRNPGWKIHAVIMSRQWYEYFRY